MNRIFFFLLGFGLMTLGFINIILYSNIIAMYNFSYYVNFISKRIECYFALIGLIIISLTIYIKGDKNYGICI